MRIPSAGFVVFVALLGSVAIAQAPDNSLLGTWVLDAPDTSVRLTFAADGTFVRSVTGREGTETVRGRYTLAGNALTVIPEGGETLTFTAGMTPGGALVITGPDGVALTLAREGRAAPPAAAGNPLVPDWVRPGLRLTYYLQTGSLSGSVGGWVLDPEGDWEHKETKQRYSKGDRVGHSSRGWLQVTVAGLDGEVAALAEPFYLLDGDDATSVLSSSLDMLATVDTGGDFWMHPTRQAEWCRKNPWLDAPQPGQILARPVRWTVGGQTYDATLVGVFGDASRTSYVFDRASGRLLCLRRLTRQPPDIRDPEMPVVDTVSYATFLEFVSARQLNLPWLAAGLPEWAGRVQSFSWRGQFTIQGQGTTPTPLALADDVVVERRGANWMLFAGRSQTQGSMMPAEWKAVTGPGCLPPLGIPPAALAGLAVGQEIDRDPVTGVVVSVVHADAQVVALRAQSPRESTTYVYDRQQGVMVRRTAVKTDRVPGISRVYEIQLAGWQ